MSVQYWPETGYYRITWPVKFNSGYIPGPIFSNDCGGFNSFQLLKFPVRIKDEKCDATNPYNWIWGDFTVKDSRYAAFVGRCEFLGPEFPWWLLVSKEKKIKMQYQEALFK